MRGLTTHVQDEESLLLETNQSQLHSELSPYPRYSRLLLYTLGVPNIVCPHRDSYCMPYLLKLLLASRLGPLTTSIDSLFNLCTDLCTEKA